ncbi:MAG: efflux RND transporter periplasmic adaptor subunit [Burkholderiales bacterium]|nr:efflux RND transporter periplasmic adaptor subunit [Burkholderiales bacterium]
MAPPSSSRPRRYALLLTGLVVVAGAAFGLWNVIGGSASAPDFRFATVERGNVVSVVSASGTLNAVTTVLVGSQISGQIKELLVDFNAQVKKGQLLARIDPETYEIRVRQAEADLEAARTAQVQKQSDAAAQRSQALRAKISYDDAKQDLDRKQSLVEKGFISGAEADKARFVERGAAEAIRTSEAQVKSAEAQIANAAAVVRQREASLAAARNDLAKTAISAPVDGIVISRQVDAGQTVAASLNTPTLFTIARDLAEMQVEVAIDESDIGKIRERQRATFTVDAFAGRSFDGRVRQIRKSAQTVQSVVTYTVVVETPNPSLLLVPGMTANVRIIADTREGVLKVPNAALRWRPLGMTAARDDPAPAAVRGASGGGDAQARRQRLVDELKLDSGQQARLDEILAESRGKFAELRDVPEADRRTRGERLRAEVRQKIGAMLDGDQKTRYAQIVAEETGRVAVGSGRVFVPDSAGKPVEVRLRLGLTDGNATEIVSGDVAEGTRVIVGTVAAGAPQSPAGGAPRLPF